MVAKFRVNRCKRCVSIGVVLLYACSGHDGPANASVAGSAGTAASTAATATAGDAARSSGSTSAGLSGSGGVIGGSAAIGSRSSQANSGVGGASGPSAAGTGGVTPLAAGSGAAAGAGATTAGAGGSATGAGGAPSPTLPGGSGPMPILPEITGECPEFKTGEFTFGGVSGVMDVGTKSEGSAPFLFYWAGTDFDASTYTSIGDNNVQKVTSEGGVIVSIQGMSGQDSECSITGYYSTDFDPPSQIAACAVRDYGIDPRRIYVTGCSAGGVTTGCMATRLSAFIAAAVPNSGGLTAAEAPADPAHVPAVMTMYGGAADFGGLFVTDSGYLNSSIKDAGGFVIDCNHGGGHCAAPQALYDAAFEFMWAHPFGVEPKPFAMALPSSFPEYCQIF